MEMKRQKILVLWSVKNRRYRKEPHDKDEYLILFNFNKNLVLTLEKLNVVINFSLDRHQCSVNVTASVFFNL